MTKRPETACKLDRDDLSFLRVLWCDNGNITRSKSIHMPSLKARHPAEMHPEHRHRALMHSIDHALTISAALQSLPCVFDEPVPEAGLEPVKEIRLVPDWSTLALPPNAPGYAYVLADMVRDTDPWELCPRELLRRNARALADKGYDLRVGAELEFFLFEEEAFYSDGRLEPADRDLYAQNSASEAVRDIVDEIAETIYGMGIPLAYYNAEAGPGQHELSLHYCGALELADHIVLAREAIKSVARDYGLISSFLPKIYQDSTGSGCHIHLSIWSEGKNVLGGDDGSWSLSAAGESFMAGVLQHLPALMAFTTPTPNSFRRIIPQYWSGAYRVWGVDNKEAALRVLADHENGYPKQFELKTSDSSANPYVALSGIIAAGTDGIARNMKLGEPLQRNPGNLSDDERSALGVELLPGSLEEALGELERDSVLRSALGEEYYRVYTAVKKFEAEHLRNFNLEKERALLLTRY